MARITLESHEIHGDLLPSVCCRCGEAATGQSTQKFSWTPKWILIFVIMCLPIYLLLALATTNRRVCTLPTCDRHYFLGFWRKALATTGTITIVFCIIWMALTSRGQIPGYSSTWDVIDRYVQIGGAATGLLLLIISNYVQVRAVHITPMRITLAGVSPLFVEATEQYRILLEEFVDT